MKRIDQFFHLSQRGTTLGRELRCGCTTFCSMAYLALVIPACFPQPHGLRRGDERCLPDRCPG